MKCKVELVITHDDGREFSKEVHEWAGLSREQTNYIEAVGLEFLGKLNKLGAELAKDPGGK